MWCGFDVLETLISRSKVELTDEDGNTLLHHVIDILSKFTTSEVYGNSAFKPLWSVKNAKKETPSYRLIMQVVDDPSLSVIRNWKAYAENYQISIQ